MLKIFRFMWQLPQNLGAIVIIKAHKIKLNSYTLQINGVKYYLLKHVGNSGVSLGDYILLDSDIHKTLTSNEISVLHEYGHHIQSMIFGPLYLIFVGIPSGINNLRNRHQKKIGWNNKELSKWYYSRYPENWADKLGGANRDKA